MNYEQSVNATDEAHGLDLMIVLIKGDHGSDETA